MDKQQMDKRLNELFDLYDGNLFNYFMFGMTPEESKKANETIKELRKRGNRTCLIWKNTRRWFLILKLATVLSLNLLKIVDIMNHPPGVRSLDFIATPKNGTRLVYLHLPCAMMGTLILQFIYMKLLN